METPLIDPPEIEYLDDEPHAKVSPRLTHALVQGAMLRVMAEAARGRGVVLPELRVDPGGGTAQTTEFVPDLSYVSFERLRSLKGEQREKPPFSPEIAVEVRSQSDDLQYLARKIARYLATGAVLVLDADPARRQVIAHSAHGAVTFTTGERFSHAAAPWLHFEVNAIFAQLDALKE
jgi:Uma2 family endonuclease